MMSFQAIEQVTKTQGHSTNASYESSPNTKKSTFTLRITLGQIMPVYTLLPCILFEANSKYIFSTSILITTQEELNVEVTVDMTVTQSIDKICIWLTA